MADLTHDSWDSAYQGATLEDHSVRQGGDDPRPNSPQMSAENVLHNSGHWVTESDEVENHQSEIVVDSILDLP